MKTSTPADRGALVLRPVLTHRSNIVLTIKAHPLACFFVLAIGLSWVYDLLLYGLLDVPLLPWGIASPIFGPTLAAFLVTYLSEGKPGAIHLLRRYLIWRVGIQWYLFSILGISAMVAVSFLILPEGIAAVAMPSAATALMFPVTYLVYFVVAGPLFEEPGWRGFALPHLQRSVGPLAGNLVLGLLWSLWHLPLFLLVPGYDGAGSDLMSIVLAYLGFTVMLVAFSYICAWVFNNCRGSLLFPILLHTSLNTSSSYIAHPGPTVMLARYACFALVALLILLATRGRLGYDGSLQQSA